MKHEKSNITYLGVFNFRDDKRAFGIKRADRRHHMYILGKTGTGKTTLLENMIAQDIWNGEGLAVFDPHGDFVEHIKANIPDKRRDDVIYLDVPNPNCGYGFNPLAPVPQERRSLAVSAIVDAFKKIWDKTWGPRLENLLRNTLFLLMDQPSATLADVRRVLYEESFRKTALERVTNPQVKEFWIKEYATMPPHMRREAIAPIMNKVDAFLTDMNLQRLLTRQSGQINLRQIMDENKILLVNLAKGRIGGDNSALLGAMLVSHLGLAALSRADMPEHERRDFYLYLDEFQNFTTLSMTEMLSELRKYRLSIIAANQYLGQIEPEVRDALLGNVGTLVFFRMGMIDAQFLYKELHDRFRDKFRESDLVNLGNYDVYIKLMTDGKPSQPFSATTMPPPESES